MWTRRKNLEMFLLFLEFLFQKFSILWNNLRTIVINSSLKVWQNLGLGFFEKGEL